MKLKIIILSIFFCALYACNRTDNSMATFDSSFSVHQELKSNLMFGDELMLGQPFLMMYVDSSLVIYDHASDSIFTLIDLNKNERVIHFGKRGQGKGELLQVFSLSRMSSDSLLGIYDCFQHKLFQTNIEEIKKGHFDLNLVKTDSCYSNRLFESKFHGFVGLGFYEKGMFSLTVDDTTSYFYEYPYQDKREHLISNRLRGLAYQGSLCMNRDRDKLVYAVYSSPIFSIYSVNDTSIKKHYEFIGGYPEYKTEESVDGFSAPMSAHNKQAFIATYATDSYIYLLYSGKSFEEHQMDAFKSSTIYRVTWDGKSDCKFELDCPITNFCVSDFDNTIYAVSEREDLELVYFKIN